MENKFKIALSTTLDTKGANNDLKTYYKQLQDNPAKLKLDIDYAKSIINTQKALQKLATDLKIKMPELSDKEALSIVMKKYKEDLSASKKLVSEEKKLVLEENKLLKETTSELAKQSKLRETMDRKNNKSKESNVKYLLQEQIKSLEKMSKLESNIILKENDGKSSSANVIKEKLRLEQEYYNKLSSELNLYNDIISVEERRNILSNKKVESGLNVDLANAKVYENTLDSQKKKTQELNNMDLSKSKNITLFDNYRKQIESTVKMTDGVKDRFNNLFSSLNNISSTDELKRWENEFAILKSDILDITRLQKEQSLLDKGVKKERIDSANNALKEQIQSLKIIGSLQSQIAQKDNGKHNIEVSLLKDNLQIEKDRYLQLSATTKTYDDIISKEERLNAMSKISLENKKNLALITSQNADKEILSLNNQTESANKIKNLMETGKIDSSIADASTQYQRLSNVTDELKTDFKQLNQYQNALSGSNTDEELISNYEKFNNTLVKVNSQINILKKQNNLEFSNLKLNKDFEKLNYRIRAFIRDNPKAASKMGNEFEALSKKVIQASKSADPSEYKKLSNSFSTLQSQAKAFGNTGNTVFSKVSQNIKNFANYMVSATVAMQALRAVEGTISTVKTLDASMVDLQMATGYTSSQTKELLTTYIKLGQAMGATGQEVANAANDYLRQGQSVADTNKLITDSIVLAKIGDLETADATTYLTTAMKGYKVSVDDVLGVVDKLSAVDMSSATSAGGLAEAMAQTATNADLAGKMCARLYGDIKVA